VEHQLGSPSVVCVCQRHNSASSETFSYLDLSLSLEILVKSFEANMSSAHYIPEHRERSSNRVDEDESTDSQVEKASQSSETTGADWSVMKTLGLAKNAYVLPVTQDGRALVTRERCGRHEKIGMLGGSVNQGETVWECMSREAKAESGGALSDETAERIGSGAGLLGTPAYFETTDSVALIHDLCVPSDFDADLRFDGKKVAALRGAIKKKTRKSKKPPTVQLGTEFVSMDKLRDWAWRSEHMSFNASVLCARLMKANPP
jgi:hypothetical protein